MPATTPLTLSTHWLSNWRLSRCLSHELPKVERGTPVLGGSGDQPPPGPLITVTSTGLSSLPGPTLSECCHSGLAGCGIPVCDAADNGAIGEHVVVVIVPFARWAGSRCAFQEQVVFVHSRAALAGVRHVRLFLTQSSSASRFTAGASAFFILSQLGERAVHPVDDQRDTETQEHRRPLPTRRIEKRGQRQCRPCGRENDVFGPEALCLTCGRTAQFCAVPSNWVAKW